MIQGTSRGVSPALSVVMLVAVSIVFSAAIGYLVIDIIQPTPEETVQEEVEVNMSVSGSTVNVEVIDGNADEARLLINGLEQDTITNVSEGDSLSGTITDEADVTVVSVRRNTLRVVMSSLAEGRAIRHNLPFWRTGSDWDASSSQTGVVHDDFGAFYGDDRISLGQPIEDDHLVYYPMDETSGTTLYDATGSGPTMTAHNATLDEFGPWRTNSIRFDGQENEYAVSDDGLSGGSEYTVVGYVYLHEAYGDPEDERWIMNLYDDTDNRLGIFIEPDGSFTGEAVSEGESYTATDSSTPADGEWHLMAIRADGENVSLWLDDTELVNESMDSFELTEPTLIVNDFIDADTATLYTTHAEYSGVQVYPSYISDERLTEGYTALSEGSLTTDTRRFDTATKPDLTNLSYDVGGGDAQVTVIGSPGTADEERQTVSLDGQDDYNLRWRGFHSEFVLRIEIQNSVTTRTPTISRIELTPP